MQLEFEFYKDYPHINPIEAFATFIGPVIKNLYRDFTGLSDGLFNGIKWESGDLDKSLVFPMTIRIDPDGQYLFRFLKEIDKNGLSGIEVGHLFLP